MRKVKVAIELPGCSRASYGEEERDAPFVRGWLAVTRRETSLFGKHAPRYQYKVTHIASGLAVCGREFTTLPQAKAALLRVLPHADWTQPKEVLLKSKGLRREFRKAMEATNA
mgnify:CR=1 FL=1